MYSFELVNGVGHLYALFDRGEGRGGQIWDVDWPGFVIRLGRRGMESRGRAWPGGRCRERDMGDRKYDD
jgi:hypothetical protein